MNDEGAGRRRGTGANEPTSGGAREHVRGWGVAGRGHSTTDPGAGAGCKCRSWCEKGPRAGAEAYRGVCRGMQTAGRCDASPCMLYPACTAASAVPEHNRADLLPPSHGRLHTVGVCMQRPGNVGTVVMHDCRTYVLMPLQACWR